MADKSINDLPAVESLADDGLLPVYQDGGAKRISGEQLRFFAETAGAEGASHVAKGDKGDKGAAGSDGITPHIGTNGNWYIGSTDTGKPSRGDTGAKGDPGSAGSDGISPVVSVETISGGHRITITDAERAQSFDVLDGASGSGSGDMKKAVYDPQGKAQDIFAYADTKYSKPSGGIPKKDLASDVQASLGKADSALQNAPVTSVNSKTGAVSLTKGDVGLGNVDNVKQYSASNPPPYPVTSVNGKTGAVTVPPVNVPSTTSLIKGNGSGGLVEATRGNDYIASGNITKQTLVATETTPTENYAINWVYG